MMNSQHSNTYAGQPTRLSWRYLRQLFKHYPFSWSLHRLHLGALPHTDSRDTTERHQIH